MSNTPPANRKPRAQIALEVVRTEWVSPHLVRVIAGGPSIAAFENNDATDRYVKLVFVKPELRLAPPYDLQALRSTLPVDDWPVVRTYTVRWFDAAAGELAIDFVVHGDEGIAGPWAASAQPGDPLVFSGPGGAYSPDPAAGWHVLAGDLSALPAIAAGLEALDASATGIVHLEVSSESDIIELTHPVGVTVNWIVTEHPDANTTPILATALDSADWPDGDVQVFAHGERESIKAVREVLRRREVPRSRISLSGYWARGRTEDVFQAEKREPIGTIAD
jgi:NADPH-dependent ferric siderophore reductase